MPNRFKTIKPNKVRKRRNPDKLTLNQSIILTPDIIKMGVEKLKRDLKGGVSIRYKNICNGLKVYCPTKSCTTDCKQVDVRFQ